MIDVKTGIQTWSNAQQTSALKSDSAQYQPSDLKEKALGGEQDIGELLNKVADPKWVNPEKTRRVGNPSLDKDAFFKLMLTQMKYQDPTTPVDSHEMAAQLAQFSSLEQLNNINSNLENLNQSQNPMLSYQSLNFIGKKVSGDSSQITHSAQDQSHDLQFQLAGDASVVKIQLRDEEGRVVREVNARQLKKGSNAVNWDGQDSNAQPLPPGTYRMSVDAQDSGGRKIATETQFSGRITGVEFSASGPLLKVGGQSVRLQDVKSIVDPSIQDIGVNSAAPAMAPAPAPAFAAAPSSAPTAPAKLAANGAPAQMVKNIAMSRDLMNKLANNK